MPRAASTALWLTRLRASPFAFPLAALAAVALLFISEASYREASRTFDGLGVQGQARTTMQVLMRGLLDAETGERGYLLTNRREYLEPYTEGKERATDALGWLDNHYRNDPPNAALMKQLDTALKARLDELQATIALAAAGRSNEARARVLSDAGKQQTDGVRALARQLVEMETARIVLDRTRLTQTLRLNRLGVGIMTALSLLALYMYLRQRRATVRQREEQQGIVQMERDQLEKEVLQRTSQLTELARHLQSAREDERSRLARELHDELGGLLTGAKLDVARLKSRLGAPSPDAVERLQHLVEGLNNGIALKRRIIEDLRPSSLSNLGLAAALDILVREWSDRTEIPVDSSLEPVQLRAAGELTVYRLVQEALNNTAKYARATLVQVSVSTTNGEARVLVRDNGVGFETTANSARAHGLLGMRYRLEAEGGRLTVTSKPGEGTSIEAHLPQSEEDVAGEEAEHMNAA
jgi:signal transduction histidine kinase